MCIHALTCIDMHWHALTCIDNILSQHECPCTSYKTRKRLLQVEGGPWICIDLLGDPKPAHKTHKIHSQFFGLKMRLWHRVTSSDWDQIERHNIQPIPLFRWLFGWLLYCFYIVLICFDDQTPPCEVCVWPEEWLVSPSTTVPGIAGLPNQTARTTHCIADKLEQWNESRLSLDLFMEDDHSKKSQCERAMAAMTHRHEASTPSQICTRPHFPNRVASQVLRLSSFVFSRNACRMLQSSVLCLRVFRLFHASLLAVHSPPCQSVQGLLPSSQLRTWDFFELLQRLKCFLRI